MRCCSRLWLGGITLWLGSILLGLCSSRRSFCSSRLRRRGSLSIIGNYTACGYECLIPSASCKIGDGNADTDSIGVQ